MSLMGSDGWLIGPDSVTDTAIDVSWSGHKGDEVDILGGSVLDQGFDDPVEDEVSARDPQTGDHLGWTNTPQLPSGESAAEEQEGGDNSPTGSGSGNTLLWVILGIAALYSAGQVFDIDLGGT